MIVVGLVRLTEWIKTQNNTLIIAREEETKIAVS